MKAGSLKRQSVPGSAVGSVPAPQAGGRGFESRSGHAAGGSPAIEALRAGVYLPRPLFDANRLFEESAVERETGKHLSVWA